MRVSGTMGSMTPPLGARLCLSWTAPWVGWLTRCGFGQFLIDSDALGGRQFSWEPRRWVVVFWTDGSVAAFAGFTVDSANRVATLEPVGTRDGHRRLGLAQAAINEGLQRVARRGVDVVHVANWGSADAGHLYGSLGFEHYATQTAWRKVVASVNP